MDNAFNKAEELAAHVKEYVNNRVEAVKLSVAEKISKTGAAVIAACLVLAFMLFCFLFLGLTLAALIAAWTGKWYWGFLAVSGLFFIISLLVWFGKSRLIQLPVMNSLLKHLSTHENEEEDEED